MPRSSPRKKPTVSYNEDSDGMPAVKTNGVSNAISKLKHAAAKAKDTATGKRKAEPEEEAVHQTEATKPIKKRKTNRKTEDTSMPLAQRTSVPSLTKAMYLGAHVSAAGGE